jgi:hypothetical protein
MTADKKSEANADEPFLARWSRVKSRQEQIDDVPARAAATKGAGAAAENTSIDGLLQPETAGEGHPQQTLPQTNAPSELPSLESLTPQSDFSPFMAKDVDAQLRNQAMKKLFTDPHYNVMDRLDTYIDDYSIHAPLPLDVIRQMSISKTLGLFAEEEDDKSSTVEVIIPVDKPAEIAAAPCPAAVEAAVASRESDVGDLNTTTRAPV